MEIEKKFTEKEPSPALPIEKPEEKAKQPEKVEPPKAEEATESKIEEVAPQMTQPLPIRVPSPEPIKKTRRTPYGTRIKDGIIKIAC